MPNKKTGGNCIQTVPSAFKKTGSSCIRTILQPFKNRQQLQVFRPGFHSTDQDFGMKSSSYFAIAKRSDMALI